MINKPNLVRLNKVFLALFLIFSQYVIAQNDFKFKRKITFDSIGWSSFDIPENLWDRLKIDGVDARILEINKSDTTEIPYLLFFPEINKEFTMVDCSILNKYSKDNFTVFTLDFFKSIQLDKLILDFIPENFEYWLLIEGSNDLKNWELIEDSCRLVGVKNQFKSFKSNEIYFKNISYRYLKIKFKQQQINDLKGVTAFQKNTFPFKYVNYSVKSQKNVVKNKKSIIHLNLKFNVPVFKLNLQGSDSVYFHRYATVKYLSDSVLTTKGYVYKYNLIWSGYIHSKQNNTVFCNNVKAKNFIITIENEDNPAINFKPIDVFGLPYSVVFNAQNVNGYFLFYGNNKLLKPSYDLQFFKNEISSKLIPVSLQNEQSLKTEKSDNKSDYSVLLYIVLAIIVFVLLFFSFKMLKESKN